MNFFVKPKAALTTMSENTKFGIKATFDNVTKVYNTYSSYDAESGAKFENVASACAFQMTTPVSVKVYYDGVWIHSVDFTVKDYCYKVLDDTTLSGDKNLKLKELCSCLLEYGAEAQDYFAKVGYYVENGKKINYVVGPKCTNNVPLNYTSPSARVATVATNPNTTTKTKTVTGSMDEFSGFKAFLVLESKIGLKIEFNYEGNALNSNTFTYKMGDGSETTLTPVKNDSYHGWYVLIRDISVVDYNKVFTITVKKDASNYVTLTYSPNTYITKYWDDEDAGTLLQQLNRFSIAAGAYVAN